MFEILFFLLCLMNAINTHFKLNILLCVEGILKIKYALIEFFNIDLLYILIIMI